VATSDEMAHEELIQDRKRHLRHITRVQRRALTAEVRRAASAALVARLETLDVVRDARGIGLYAPFDGEIDPLALLDAPMCVGKVIGWPHIGGAARAMTFREAPSATEPGHPGYSAAVRDGMARGELGIGTPTGATLSAAVLDVLIVPGVLFTHSGARLGMGAGYYDRFLTGFQGTTLGVGYDWQRVDALPTEPHDRLLSYVVTPSEVVRCGAG